MIVWEIRNFTFQRKSNIFGGQTNFVVLSWVANHDCHICMIVALPSSSMINGCFMVGEHVNILKKTKLWKLRYDQSCIQTRQTIVSNIMWLLQKWWFVWFISLSSSENVHFSKNKYWAKLKGRIEIQAFADQWHHRDDAVDRRRNTYCWSAEENNIVLILTFLFLYFCDFWKSQDIL